MFNYNDFKYYLGLFLHVSTINFQGNVMYVQVFFKHHGLMYQASDNSPNHQRKTKSYLPSKVQQKITKVNIPSKTHQRQQNGKSDCLKNPFQNYFRITSLKMSKAKTECYHNGIQSIPDTNLQKSFNPQRNKRNCRYGFFPLSFLQLKLTSDFHANNCSHNFNTENNEPY